jgi:bacterial/archaeal transporter family-2 protein
VAGKRGFSLERGGVATWAYLSFVFAAGAMLPIQFGINAQLADWIDSPLRATLVSFVVGNLALVVATVAFARGWPGSERIGSAPWWIWIGGLLGAF